jgi:hypothetical protein
MKSVLNITRERMIQLLNEDLAGEYQAIIAYSSSRFHASRRKRNSPRLQVARLNRAGSATLLIDYQDVKKFVSKSRFGRACTRKIPAQLSAEPVWSRAQNGHISVLPSGPGSQRGVVRPPASLRVTSPLHRKPPSLGLNGVKGSFHARSLGCCEWSLTRAYPAEGAACQKVISDQFEENNGGIGV